MPLVPNNEVVSCWGQCGTNYLAMGNFMLRPWKIGTFFGVETRVHWSFILLPIYYLISNYKFGLLGAGLAVVLSLFLLFFVLLHEFGHVLAARVFKIPTANVTLYPIGGVALMQRQAHSPLEEIVIAVAGPAVNLVLAILLGVIAFASGIPFEADGLLIGLRTFAQFYSALIQINIALLVFNMMPAFPMDGGRVLRAFFWFFVDLITATRWATYVAIPFALLIALLGILTGSFFAVIIAGLVVLLGRLELYGLRMRLEAKQQQELEVAAFGDAPVPSAANGAWQLDYPAPELDFNGYTWDARASGWVEWRSGRPVRLYRMQHW